jgi:hypothetical protein
MESTNLGFDLGKVIIGTLKLLKDKGLLAENEVLDLLWDALRLG